MDVHWSVHKRWVKTLGNVMWLADLRRNMYVQQREQHQCPLMPADSEPQGECDHLPNWVTVGKAKQGGSEMGKYPPCQEEWQYLSTSMMWNTPTHQKRDPHHP